MINITFSIIYSLGVYSFHCTPCNFDGVAGKSEIQKHALSKKHKQLISSCKNQQTLTGLASIASSTKLNEVVNFYLHTIIK